VNYCLLLRLKRPFLGAMSVFGVLIFFVDRARRPLETADKEKKHYQKN
jgi:hypothetical protein